MVEFVKAILIAFPIAIGGMIGVSEADKRNMEDVDKCEFVEYENGDLSKPYTVTKDC